MTHPYQSAAIPLEIDPLAVALTRPPLFMGINLRLFFADLIISLLTAINTHMLYGVVLFVAVYLIFLRCSMKDPNFFRLWLTALRQTPPVLNWRFWGKTNSYSPW